MIEGVNKVVIEVADQDRAVQFWVANLGFSVVQDARYGDERWIEVRTPDRGMVLVLSRRRGDPPSAPGDLPSSNVSFCCGDLPQTYEELRALGVAFPQPPVQQAFGWWSMFEDQEGNRFALRPCEEGPR